MNRSMINHWRWIRRSLIQANRSNIHRCVYSGPYTTPDFTKLPAGMENESWESKKMRNIRQRVIDNNKGTVFDGDEKYVDDEHRIVSSLPHFIFTDEPKKYMQSEQMTKVIGHSVPEKEKDHNKTSNIDPDFARPEVREILARLQGRDFSKVFEKRQAKPSEMPRVRLLTDAQLKEEMEEISRKADELLTMPPVMLEREPIDEVLAEDDDLDGYEHCNLVFTDITEDLNHNDRFVVVREPSGQLRKATWDERDRMLHTFYHKPFRTIEKPAIFNNMEVAFENKLHENVLEQIVIQYNPDASQYIELTQNVYDHVNENQLFDLLRSTRFFGSLVFYLAKYHTIDNVLMYFIKENEISEAADVVLLYTYLKPDSVTAGKLPNVTEDTEKIKVYISCDANDKANLLDSLNQYENTMPLSEEIS